jgi:hypothetical protein
MLIDQTLAEREFEGEDPIGRHVLAQEVPPDGQQLGDAISWEIVGGAYVSNSQGLTYRETMQVSRKSQTVARHAPRARKEQKVLRDAAVSGGEGGIRTPGTLRFNGFQDRRIRPLCHLSALLKIAACATSGWPAGAAVQRTMQAPKTATTVRAIIAARA